MGGVHRAEGEANGIGVSLIIFNSEKANEIKQTILEKGYHNEYNLSEAKPYNQFNGNTKVKDSNFYKHLINNDAFDEVVKRYLPLSIKNKVKITISRIIPNRIKSIMKKLLH